MVSLLIAVIVAALIFDYINGFHDAANAIATSVSTGVLHIRTAVMVAALFNFIGAMTGTAVAKTIAGDFADPGDAGQTVVLAALIGATVWNLFTWWRGIPSSSSHALVGGLAGAVTVHAGFGAFHWDALVGKVLVPLVISPLLGFVVAFFAMVGLLWLFRRTRPAKVNGASRKMQLASACAMAFSHGSNDAQKVMGIITLALTAVLAQPGASLPAWSVPAGAESVCIASADGTIVPSERCVAPTVAASTPSTSPAPAAAKVAAAAPAYRWVQGAHDICIATHPANIDKSDKGPCGKKQSPAVPLWVILACAAAIAIGTMAGGKRIIKTMGSKIIRINPLQGFAAETAGTVTILGASVIGVPVSTTHCINAAIMGVGAVKRLSAVRWGVAGNIVVAWVLTIPLSALAAGGAMALLELVS
ncbi:MAG: inorganic phosphate transporter [Myxococcota bacterium]